MKGYDQLLQEDVEDYTGLHAGLVAHAPAFFRLLSRFLEDPRLPGRLRPLVLAAIAYFVVPSEIMPEDLEGPYGYVDDLFLSAWVARLVRQRVGEDEILTENWESEVPLLPLIAEILQHEAELIGENRELILWFIGYEYLSK
jgi:uncharacterized membrane protein YkvA (DUF1232 family)